MDIMMFKLNGSVIGPSKTRWVVRANGKELALVVQPGKALLLTECPQVSHSVLLGLPSHLYKKAGGGGCGNLKKPGKG